LRRVARLATLQFMKRCLVTQIARTKVAKQRNPKTAQSQTAQSFVAMVASGPSR
jgi:hypothetical protein